MFVSKRVAIDQYVDKRTPPPLSRLSCLFFPPPIAPPSLTDSIPYAVLLLAWGGVFGAFFTEFDAPYNSALNSVSANLFVEDIHKCTRGGEVLRK